eukprot:scaffold248409_cov63-Cyclotella_meneghiniana.AAC.5
MAYLWMAQSIPWTHSHTYNFDVCQLIDQRINTTGGTSHPNKQLEDHPLPAVANSPAASTILEISTTTHILGILVENKMMPFTLHQHALGRRHNAAVAQSAKD